ncbi:helix-turn-helix domain-containing protein [Pedococcus sp. P5_B7]
MTVEESASQVAQLLGLSPLPGPVDAAAPALDVEVGRRVRVARRRAGMEAAALATAVGLSADKLSKIENGKRRVAPRELPALARVLRVSMSSLMGVADVSRPALALAHRVAAGAGEGATSGARGRAISLLEAEDRLAQRSDLPGRQLSPAGAAVAQLVAQDYAQTPRTKPEAVRQGRSLAEEVRKHLELGASAVGDLPALIEMHFAADVALSPLGDGSDGLCAHDGDAALLVVNTDFPLGRTRFTLAHELGHHLLNDARDVIEERQSDMYAGTYLERRVNSFAAHLLLPVKAVRDTMTWLGATAQDMADGTTRGQLAIGYLMAQHGVSLPCALGQIVDAGFLTVVVKERLVRELSAGNLVRVAQPWVPDRPGPEQVLRELRPPARLSTAAVEAARSGAVGMHTVSVVLGREDDEQLLDEVMFGVFAPAMA